MGRNGYSGIEVFVTKLNNGTRFTQRNGTGKGVFVNTSGYPVIIDDNEDEYTIPDNYIMNISTTDVIPFEAYVYSSVFYAEEIRSESEKLNNIQLMIKDTLLTESELSEICMELNSTISNLKYLTCKFESIQAENYSEY